MSPRMIRGRTIKLFRVLSSGALLCARYALDRMRRCGFGLRDDFGTPLLPTDALLMLALAQVLLAQVCGDLRPVFGPALTTEQIA